MPTKKLLSGVVKFGFPQVTIKLPPASKHAPAPPLVNGEPLMVNPVLSILSLSQLPAAMTTVLDRPAEPAYDPMMVLSVPVVTEIPESAPMNMLFVPMVFSIPAVTPTNMLLNPVMLSRPAASPRKILLLPEVVLVPVPPPIKILFEPVVLHSPAAQPIKTLLIPVVVE